MKPLDMCFGLNDELTKESFKTFLQLIGRKEFTDFLSKRVPNDQIESFVNDFTLFLKKNISEDEYHKLFLMEENKTT